MVVSMIICVPAREKWTSGISPWAGVALLGIGAIPDLSRSPTVWRSMSCTLLWRLVFSGRETVKWLRTWNPSSGDQPQRRQTFVGSEDHGFPHSGRITRRALCISIQSAISRSVRQDSVLAMSSKTVLRPRTASGWAEMSSAMIRMSNLLDTSFRAPSRLVAHRARVH